MSVISTGALNCAVFHPREVITVAILAKAAFRIEDGKDISCTRTIRNFAVMLAIYTVVGRNDAMTLDGSSALSVT